MYNYCQNVNIVKAALAWEATPFFIPDLISN